MSSLTAMYLLEERPILIKWEWRRVPWVMERCLEICFRRESVVVMCLRVLIGFIGKRALMAPLIFKETVMLVDRLF